VLIVETLYVPAGRPAVTSAVRSPLFATAFKPLKKANRWGLVGFVCVCEEMDSTTTCEWPMICPFPLTCWGAE